MIHFTSQLPLHLPLPHLCDVDEKALVEEIPDMVLSERLLVVNLCIDVKVQNTSTLLSAFFL